MKEEVKRAPFHVRDTISLLEIVDLEGNVETLHRFDHCAEAPNWTRDGKSLIFNAQGLIKSYNFDTKTIDVIDTGYVNRCNNDHVLSFDGVGLAVSHQTIEDGQSRIYTLPLSGGTPRLITPLAPSYLHGWSKDGQTLAYCAGRSGVYNIYTIPVQGGEETRLTDTNALDDGPEFSPDGTTLWFNSTRSGLMQIFKMNVDGTDQTQMTFDERNNWFPHVSPDNQLIAYISYRKDEVKPADHPADKNVEIRIMTANGGSPRTLVALFGGQGTMNVNSWAPDSKHLAYMRYEKL